jgi:hypothetical protein
VKSGIVASEQVPQEVVKEAAKPSPCKEVNIANEDTTTNAEASEQQAANNVIAV